MKRISLYNKITVLAAGLGLFLAMVEPVSVSAQTQIVAGSVVIKSSPWFASYQLALESEGDQVLLVEQRPLKAKFEAIDTLKYAEILPPQLTEIDSILIPVFEEKGNPQSRVLKLEAHRVVSKVQDKHRNRYVVTTGGRIIHYGNRISADRIVVQPAVPVLKGEQYFEAITRFNEENHDTAGFGAMNPHTQIDIRPLNYALNLEALKAWARQGFEIKEVTPVERPTAVVLDFAKAFAAKKRKCAAEVVAQPETPAED